MLVRKLVSPTFLLFFLSLPLCAQTATVSGRLHLEGPPRSFAGAVVTLRDVIAFHDQSSLEAFRADLLADGHFTFTGVRAGIYVLQADGRGLISEQWGASGAGLAGKALVVRTGENLKDLVLSVTARPVLCGRVFGTDGKPVPYASVHAWVTDAEGKGMMQGGDMDGGNIAADSEGRYRFTNMNPGLYIVGAYLPDQPDGSFNKTVRTGFWQESATREDGLPIPLVANGAPDTCPYDLHLHAERPAYTGPRYRVEGRLAPGAAVDVKPSAKLVWHLNAYVSLRDQVGMTRDVPYDPTSPSFSFTGLPPGKYNLILAPPDHGLESFSGPCFPFSHLDVSVDFTIDHANLSGLIATLAPVSTIHGRVENVRTPQDGREPPSPASRYYVGLGEQGNCTAANAEADGSFTFAKLDPGEFHIYASRSALAEYTQSVTLNGAPAPDGILHLAPGDNLVRILNRSDSGRIDAVIDAKTATGAPAHDEHNNWFGGQAHVVLIDAKGRYFNTSIGVGAGRFAGELPPGRYTAVAGRNEQLTWAWTGGSWNDARVLQAMSLLGTPFEIKPGERTTLTLIDRTVEIQDLTARLGLPMYRR